YVEGPSDRLSLEELLRPVITRGSSNRIGIRFLPLGSKSAVLDDSPRKAADRLLDNPQDWVFSLPDLYPMTAYNNSKNAHSSFEPMHALLLARFNSRADAINLSVARRVAYRIHCLKYNLEALLLACPDQLRSRLRTQDALNGRWRHPVENQNDGQPPKRIVEA